METTMNNQKFEVRARFNASYNEYQANCICFFQSEFLNLSIIEQREKNIRALLDNGCKTMDWTEYLKAISLMKKAIEELQIIGDKTHKVTLNF